MAFSPDIPEETLPKREIVVSAALKLTSQLLPFFLQESRGKGGGSSECHEWSFNIGRKGEKRKKRTKHTRCHGMSSGGGGREGK